MRNLFRRKGAAKAAPQEPSKELKETGDLINETFKKVFADEKGGQGKHGAIIGVVFDPKKPQELATHIVMAGDGLEIGPRLQAAFERAISNEGVKENERAMNVVFKSAMCAALDAQSGGSAAVDALLRNVGEQDDTVGDFLKSIQRDKEKEEEKVQTRH